MTLFSLQETMPIQASPGRAEHPAGAGKTVPHGQLQEGEEDPQVSTINQHLLRDFMPYQSMRGKGRQSLGQLPCQQMPP
jgi:hypothetical protein